MRALLLVTALVLIAPTAMAQDPAPTDATPTEPSPTDAASPPPSSPAPDPSATTTPPPSDNATPDAPQDGENATPPPQDFSANGSRYSGAFLSLDLNASAFAIGNVTYAHDLFVTGLRANASAPTPTAGDASLVLDAPEAALTAVDGESAGLQLVARAELRVEIAIAEGLAVAMPDASSAHVTTSAGNTLDVEAGPNATLAWDEATRTLTVSASPSSEDALELRFAPPSVDAVDQGAAKAFDNGTLGGEVTVAPARVVASDYGDMRVVASATRDQAILIVRAASHEPRVVLVNVLAGALGEGRLSVLLDGAPVQEARTVAEAFDPANLTQPEYFLVTTQTQTQVVVSLPHLSEHTIQIQSIGTAVQRAVADPRAPLVIAGALVVTLALGYALVRRR